MGRSGIPTAALVRSLPLPRLGALQFFDGLHDPNPRPLAGHVAGGQQLVGLHGGLERRVLAVLVDEQLGAAVDVEVGGHWRNCVCEVLSWLKHKQIAKSPNEHADNSKNDRNCNMPRPRAR